MDVTCKLLVVETVNVNEKKSANKLQETWQTYLDNNNIASLTKYLSENSNLPGPRANLTLAYKLAQLASESWPTYTDYLKRCITEWSKDDEYLRTCRNITLGYILASHSSEEHWITPLLYEDNYNSMWRPREAVTLGLEETLRKRPTYTLNLLEGWNNGDLIVLRNTLMILASPPILSENVSVRESLRQYTVEAMNRIKQDTDSKPKGHDILKKSLGFIISVAVVADPEILILIEKWVKSGEKTWRSILISNLKKKRLTRHYPEETSELLKLLKD